MFLENTKGVFDFHEDRLIRQGMSEDQTLERMFLESGDWGL